MKTALLNSPTDGHRIWGQNPAIGPYYDPHAVIHSLALSMTFGDPNGGYAPAVSVIRPYESKVSANIYRLNSPSDKVPASSDYSGSNASADKGNVPPPCAYKGICEGSVATVVPNGISVIMIVNEGNPGILLMSFNINELQRKQPQKVADFLQPNSTYQFSSTQILTDPMFAPLHLLHNARISPKSSTKIITEREKITVEIQYDHD